MNPVFEKRKKQKILIGILILCLAITFFNLYLAYFKEKIPIFTPKAQIKQEPLIEERKIEIEWKIFDHPIFEKIVPLPPVEKLPAEAIGRENPFSLQL